MGQKQFRVFAVFAMGWYCSFYEILFGVQRLEFDSSDVATMFLRNTALNTTGEMS